MGERSEKRTPQTEWVVGDLSISRTTSNVREDYITLTLRVGEDRTDIEVELADFAAVLTGLGRQSVGVRKWVSRG